MSYVYVRTHKLNVNTTNVVKIGITDCLGSRDCAYATGEFIREKFIFVYKVDNTREVEKTIYIKFNKFKVQNTGGTEFYSDKILEDLQFNDYMQQYIKLSDKEISELLRIYRQRQQSIKRSKINMLIRKLIRKKIIHLKVVNVKKEREYQTTIIQYCYENILKHFKIYLKQPTGTGKTFVGYNIIKKLDSNIIIIFSPRQIVNRQNASNTILDHAIFNYSNDTNLQGFLKIKKNVIIVACLQSAERLYEEFSQYHTQNTTVWFDEAHWGLDNWITSLDNYKKYWLSDTNIKYRLFTSASPNEEVVNENVKIFGELYAPISIRKFINEKWLAPITPLIYSEDNKNVNKIKYMLDDFTEKNRTFGFSFHNDCIHAHEMFIKHVQLYNDKLTKIKPFLLVTKQFDRLKLDYDYTTIKQFECNTNSVAYVVAQYSMGYDFSKLDFIYFGDPKFSFKDIIQSIGRGFRPDGLGKDGTNLSKTLIVSLPVFVVNEETDYENIIKVLEYLLNEVNLSFDDIVFQNRNKSIHSNSTPECDTGDELIKSKLLDLLEKRKIKRYISYKDARDINIQHNICTPGQYREYCKKDLRLCENPEKHYKGFEWFYFLGINRDRLGCYSLDECKKKVIEYIKLYPEFKEYNSISKFNAFTYELYELDKLFPPKDLWVYYYDKPLNELIQFPPKKSKGIFG